MEYQDRVVKTVEKTLPAVVSIAISKTIEDIEKEIPTNFDSAFLPYRDLIEQQLRQAPRDEAGRVKLGGGSGFIISTDGIALTNKHVVMDPHAMYTIVTTAGETHEAKVLARDPVKDIAVLKIDGKKLPFLSLAQSGKIKLGETVIAIGNALGEFQNSVSTGVVSGLSRLITAVTDMSGRQERLGGLIQTDAAINPGNSGGPLVNLAGEVIGINVAVVFGAQNIGFAIPTDQAIRDLEEIKRYGRIRRPFLGVRYILLDNMLQKRFHLPIDHGALIVNEGIQGESAIVEGSAAEKAGLKEFDVVIASEEKKITPQYTLEDIVSSHAIGDTVPLTIWRNGKEEQKAIVLEEFSHYKHKKV